MAQNSEIWVSHQVKAKTLFTLERERCRLENGYGTHLLVATLTALLGVNS